jgi:hypothetical protein
MKIVSNLQLKGGSMDVFETGGKAIDLYAAEVKRRVEQLEKTIKEKDETIKKHKDREGAYAAALVVLVAVVFGFVFFLVMNTVYPTTDNPPSKSSPRKNI